MQVSCDLQGADPNTIEPFPASREAKREGCCCPAQAPVFRGIVYFDTECPVHQLVKEVKH
jgi:hypothetical protein